jgi:hypothetical protein
MGLLNAIGAWFEKITDGWVFGTALSKLIFTKNVEIQGTDSMQYTHEFQFPFLPLASPVLWHLPEVV